MTWWIWLLVGLACLAVEVMTPGGVIMLFFGVSAAIIGVLSALGVSGPLWFQILLFSFLSIISLLTLRSPIMKFMNRDDAASLEIDSLVGETAVLMQDLSPGDIGKAELRGTAWSVQNVGGEQLTAGQRCKVSKVEGLNLMVRAG